MDRTPLREAFFAEAKTDPYLHLIQHMLADAWARGYRRALTDATAAVAGDPHAGTGWQSFSDLRRRALGELTEDADEASRVVALAKLGGRLNVDTSLRTPPDAWA
jgi:hypothetical protein